MTTGSNQPTDEDDRSGRTIFTTDCADLVANFIERVPVEWAIADTKEPGLADTDDTIDTGWADSAIVTPPETGLEK